jgi:hypothetical protein
LNRLEEIEAFLFGSGSSSEEERRRRVPVDINDYRDKKVSSISNSNPWKYKFPPLSNPDFDAANASPLPIVTKTAVYVDSSREEERNRFQGQHQTNGNRVIFF